MGTLWAAYQHPGGDSAGYQASEDFWCHLFTSSCISHFCWPGGLSQAMVSQHCSQRPCSYGRGGGGADPTAHSQSALACGLLTMQNGRMRGCEGCGPELTPAATCLVLPEHRHLLLQADVLLLQLRIVLQQSGLPELVLLDVISEAAPLKLHVLVDLPGGRRV